MDNFKYFYECHNFLNLVVHAALPGLTSPITQTLVIRLVASSPFKIC